MQVFACLAGGYLMSYGLRAINATIAPELVADLGLGNAELGTLSAAYFLGFAAMQLPLGVWLDRHGARRTNSALLLVAATGCALFAIAQSMPVLWVARFLIGAGVAGALMASLRAFRFWYAPDRQQQLMAWMLVAGSAGALIATVPSRLALPLIGWRGLFWVAAAALVVASLAIRFGLPRNEPLETRAKGGTEQGFAGYMPVFRSRWLWRFIPLAICLHSGFIAFQSLWAGRWFTQVLGLSPTQAGEALFAMNLLLMFSYLALGSVVRGLVQRGWTMPRIVVWTTVTIVMLHLGLLFVRDPVLGLALCLLYAVLTPPYTVLQSHVGLAYPERLTGRALTAYNLLLFGGMFVMQWAFGGLVDLAMPHVPDEAAAFAVAMGVWVVLEVAALTWMLRFQAQRPDAD